MFTKAKKLVTLMLAVFVIISIGLMFGETKPEANDKISLTNSEGQLTKGFTVKLKQTRYLYSGGSRVTPKFSVRYNKKTLIEGRDYKWWTVNSKKVGTATLAVKGIGKYRGTYKTKFQIVPRTAKYIIAKVKTGTYTYDGNPKKPAIIAGYHVAKKTVRLKNGRDFTVVYKNNVNVGQAKALLTLKGNYSGKKSITFTIVNKSMAPTSVPTKRPNTPTPLPPTRKPNTPTPVPTRKPNTPTPVPPTPKPHTPTPIPPTKRPATPTPTPHVHQWEAVTKTVHHDEVGHWGEDELIETVMVEPFETHSHEETKAHSPFPYTETEYASPISEIRQICGCGYIYPRYAMDVMDAHTDEDIAKYGTGYGYHSGRVVLGYEHWRVPWIVDRAAYDEEVVTGYVCKGCGATKSK